jgi:hypothetical protein
MQEKSAEYRERGEGYLPADVVRATEAEETVAANESTWAAGGEPHMGDDGTMGCADCGVARWRSIDFISCSQQRG